MHVVISITRMGWEVLEAEQPRQAGRWHKLCKLWLNRLDGTRWGVKKKRKGIEGGGSGAPSWPLTHVNRPWPQSGYRNLLNLTLGSPGGYSPLALKSVFLPAIHKHRLTALPLQFGNPRVLRL